MKRVAWAVVLFLLPLLAVIGLVRMAEGKDPRHFLPSYSDFMSRIYAMPDFGQEVIASYEKWRTALEYINNNVGQDGGQCAVFPQVPTQDVPACENYFAGTLFDGKVYEVIPTFFNMVGNAISMPFKVVGYVFETLFAL